MEQITINKLSTQGFTIEENVQLKTLFEKIDINIRQQINGGLAGRIISYIKHSIDKKVEGADPLELFTVIKCDVLYAFNEVNNNRRVTIHDSSELSSNTATNILDEANDSLSGTS